MPYRTLPTVWHVPHATLAAEHVMTFPPDTKPGDYFLHSLQISNPNNTNVPVLTDQIEAGPWKIGNYDRSTAVMGIRHQVYLMIVDDYMLEDGWRLTFDRNVQVNQTSMRIPDGWRPASSSNNAYVQAGAEPGGGQLTQTPDPVGTGTFSWGAGKEVLAVSILQSNSLDTDLVTPSANWTKIGDPQNEGKSFQAGFGTNYSSTCHIQTRDVPLTDTFANPGTCSLDRSERIYTTTVAFYPDEAYTDLAEFSCTYGAIRDLSNPGLPLLWSKDPDTNHTGGPASCSKIWKMAAARGLIGFDMDLDEFEFLAEDDLSTGIANPGDTYPPRSGNLAASMQSDNGLSTSFNRNAGRLKEIDDGQSGVFNDAYDRMCIAVEAVRDAVGATTPAQVHTLDGFSARATGLSRFGRNGGGPGNGAEAMNARDISSMMVYSIDFPDVMDAMRQTNVDAPYSGGTWSLSHGSLPTLRMHTGPRMSWRYKGGTGSGSHGICFHLTPSGNWLGYVLYDAQGNPDVDCYEMIRWVMANYPKYFETGPGPQGVSFATSSWLDRGGPLTGVVSGKQATGAGLFRIDDTGSLRVIMAADDNQNRDIISSAGTVIIQYSDATGATKVDARTLKSYNDNRWHHYCYSFDVAAGQMHLYIDDVADLDRASLILEDAVLDFEKADRYFAGTPAGQWLTGCVADFWRKFNVYTDLSDTANRRKFVGPGGYTVANLGPTGEAPGLGQPDVYFSGDLATWHINKGTGGGFTIQGTAPGSCAVAPPPYLGGAPATSGLYIGGDLVQAVKLQSTDVQKIYLGSQEIWP